MVSQSCDGTGQRPALGTRGADGLDIEAGRPLEKGLRDATEKSCDYFLVLWDTHFPFRPPKPLKDREL